MDKQHIRERIRAERNSLTPEYVEQKSLDVYARLIELPELQEARTVLTYADFSNEIRMGKITGWLLYQGKIVALPVVEDHAMYAVRYSGGSMARSGFGIEQPTLEKERTLDPAQISVILCPGLAFSKDKQRIGFGRGYYDRFMEKTPKAFKIGIAYGFQVLSAIPAEPQDVAMDMIVTPDYIIR